MIPDIAIAQAVMPSPDPARLRPLRVGIAPTRSVGGRDLGMEIIGLVLLAIVFVLDLLLPRGYAGGMLYVVPMVLGLWISSPRFVVALAAAAGLLTVIGFAASTGEVTSTVLLNRVGALVSIGVVGVAVVRSRRDQMQLRETEEVLRDLHALASDPDLTLADGVRSVLRMGCDRFGLSMGMLSRIDGDTLHVVDVVVPPGTLAPGDAMQLRGVACARTISATVPVHIDIHAGTGGFVPERYHPALPIEVYIGAPVRVGKRIHGTLAFWGRRTRDTRILSTDHEIIKLMARWVGAEIERHESIQTLARTERQFQQAQKLEAVGRLAAGIAHDFNNLLMGMGGCVTLARRRIGAASPAVGVLDQLRDAIERGSSITRQLLTFSRKQGEGSEHVRVKVDDVLRAGEGIVGQLLGEDIELEVRPGAGDFQTSLAPGQLDQILMNLSVNARDAMSTGDRLTIESEVVCLRRDEPDRPAGLSAGEYAAVTVTDTGAGMDANTRARVFEPFFTTKEVGHGTGLGLATVYAMLDRIGGHISLDSEVGRGTRFRVLLPRAPERESAPASEKQARPRRGGETVLVVEDEDLVRQAIASELEPWGYELLLVASGEEALELCSERRGSIDLLLTDMVLPRMRGTEIAARARTLIPGLAVIFMSAYPREQLEREGRIDKDAVTLQKPFHVDELMGWLRELLGPGDDELDTQHGDAAGAADVPRSSAPSPASPERGEDGATAAASTANFLARSIEVLLVEDDELSRKISQELLEEMGYHVVAVASGHEARAHFDTPIDILITDLNLPDAKGPDLVEDLRIRHPNVPAIVTSGASPYEGPIRRLLAEPRIAYVGKPIDIDDLDRVARALIADTPDARDPSPVA